MVAWRCRISKNNIMLARSRLSKKEKIEVQTQGTSSDHHDDLSNTSTPGGGVMVML